MKQDPFTFPTFPTFADIPNSVRQKVYAALKKKLGQNPKKIREMKAAWVTYFGSACPSCGIEMTLDHKQADAKHFATIDHILARGLGGHNIDYHNLTCICRECNGIKSAYESRLKLLLLGDLPMAA